MVRPLLPATAPPANAAAFTSISATELKKRRRAHKNISVACERCRKYKTKCDGKQPVCSACTRRSGEGTICFYDAGNSRSALRQRNDELQKLLAEKTNGKSDNGTPQSQSPTSSSPDSSENSLTWNNNNPRHDLTWKHSDNGSTDAKDGSNGSQQLDKPVADTGQDGESVFAFLHTLASQTADTATRDSICTFMKGKAQQHRPFHLSSFSMTTPDSIFEEERTYSFQEPTSFPDTTLAYDLPLHGQHALPDFLPADMTAFYPPQSLPHSMDNINIPSTISAISLPPDMSSMAYADYELPASDLGHFAEPTELITPHPEAEVSQHHISQAFTPQAHHVRAHDQLSPSPVNGFMPFFSSIKANHYPISVQNMQYTNMQVAPHAIELLWQSPMNIISGPARWASDTFTEIRKKSRWLISNGTDIEAIIGPTSLQGLLDPRVRDPNREMNVSDWAQAFCSNFPDLSLSDRVACWAIFYRVLRWQSHPCPSTYASVPHWCRPGPAETFIPHMPILVCLIWPDLRRHFVEHDHDTDWVHAIMSSISVQWPHSEDLVLERNERSGMLEVSEVFDQWIGRWESWSISKDSVRLVPSIEGKALLRDGP